MKIVAQILASTDSRNEWTPHTLELLTDAANLAQQLDGDVAAWVLAHPHQDSVGNTGTLAKHGCHVLYRLSHLRFARWSSEAVAMALAQNTEPGCRVIFLPGTARGEEVAANLAVHFDGVWVPDVISLAVTRTGNLETTAVEPGGRLSRTHQMLVVPGHTNTGRTAIVTMRPGVAEACPIGTQTDIHIEDVEVDLSDVLELTRVEYLLPADPKNIDITFADRVVAGGRGMDGPDGMRLVESLAEKLDASLAASRVAVDLGWATPDRQVGQTGKTVRPEIYVACGISGASHHLAGMRDSRHIVAINTDSAAPIHEVAHLSLNGDLQLLIPAICEAIARRQDSMPNHELPKRRTKNQ